MALTDITRSAVEQAIAEFNQLGRRNFLEKYHFGMTKRYFLVHEGKNYDSKAIVGAAHGYLTGRKPLKPTDFSGGAATVQALLERLGFTMRVIASIR